MVINNNVKTVKKAIIPAAGFGTRLFPASKVVKKELFPIIDQDGRAKPIIVAIVEEAISGGIEEIGIVVQEDDLAVFTELFKSSPQPELWRKLSPENQAYSHYLQSLGARVSFLIQSEQAGFGHAVYCAKDWIQDDPFLLLLGDHLYASDTNISCARQLIEAYTHLDRSVMGLTVMSADVMHKAGCATGEWQEMERLLKLTQIYEKPNLDYAKTHLQVKGLGENKFLGVFGMYILEPIIFNYLEANIKDNNREKGEFQLTTCLEQIRQDLGMYGYLVQGHYFDTGMPKFYRQTVIDFAQASS